MSFLENEKGRKIAAIVSAVVFLLLFFGIALVAGKPLVSFAGNPEKFRGWVEERGIAGALAFIGMVTLQTVIAIIPGEPFEIVAGYAFGAVRGTLFCVIGTTVGAALVFLFVRRFGIRFAQIFFPKEKLESLRFLKESRRLYVLFFLLFLIPGTPKDLLCYFAGLTRVNFPVWLLLTSVARLPSIISSSFGGHVLGSGDWRMAVLIFVIVAVVSGLGLLLYRAVCRINRKRQESEKK